MTSSDIQNILNTIARFNKAIDLKHWDSLETTLSDDVRVEFPSSSIDVESALPRKEFAEYLQVQLKELKSQHRDYNFNMAPSDDVVCKCDFRVEVFSAKDTLISGASGVHFYTMINDEGRWKIGGIKRKIVRLEKPIGQLQSKDSHRF